MEKCLVCKGFVSVKDLVNTTANNTAKSNPHICQKHIEQIINVLKSQKELGLNQKPRVLPKKKKKRVVLSPYERYMKTHKAKKAVGLK